MKESTISVRNINEKKKYKSSQTATKFLQVLLKFQFVIITIVTLL